MSLGFNFDVLYILVVTAYLNISTLIFFPNVSPLHTVAFHLDFDCTDNLQVLSLLCVLFLKTIASNYTWYFIERRTTNRGCYIRMNENGLFPSSPGLKF